MQNKLSDIQLRKKAFSYASRNEPFPDDCYPVVRDALLQAIMEDAPARTFKKKSGGWLVGDSVVVYIKTKMEGFRYIHRLLQQPYDLIHVLEFYDGTLIEKNHVNIIDDQAKREYLVRIKILESTGQKNHAHEIQEIKKYLNENTYQGYSRPFVDNSEKARTCVQKKISRAIAEIRCYDSGIADYLKKYIHTGFQVSYSPPRSLTQWILF